MYPGLAGRLAAVGVAALRLDYRRPNQLSDCLADVKAGLEFIGAEAVAVAHGQAPQLSSHLEVRTVIVGWSFGGAVALQAGQRFDSVVAVATVASQTAQVGSVGRLAAAGKPLLLLHGGGDTCLSDRCSRSLYESAGQPKELVIYPEDDHGLARNVADAAGRLAAFILAALPTGDRAADGAGGRQ
jgi:dienelactone hydrolase